MRLISGASTGSKQKIDGSGSELDRIIEEDRKRKEEQKRQQEESEMRRREEENKGVFDKAGDVVSNVRQSVADTQSAIETKMEPVKQAVVGAVEERMVKAIDTMIRGYEPTGKRWEEMSLLEKADAVKKEMIDKTSLPDKTIETVAQTAGAAGGLAKIGEYTPPALIGRGILNAIGIDTSKNTAAADYLMEAQTRFSKRYEKDLTPETYDPEDNLLQNPKLFLNAEYVGDMVSSQMPHLVAALFTGGMSEGFFEAGSSMQGRHEKNVEVNKEDSVKDVLYSTTIGVVNGVIGKFGFDLVFAKNPALKKMVNDRIQSSVGRYITKVGLSGSAETVGEYLQEIIPVIATKVVYDEGGTWKEVIKAGNKQGLTAASAALLVSGPVAAISNAGGNQEEIGGAQKAQVVNTNATVVDPEEIEVDAKDENYVQSLRDDVVSLQTEIQSTQDPAAIDEISEQLAEKSADLTNYANTFKENAVNLVDENERSLMSISVVKFDDGKWAHSFTADADTIGTGASFDFQDLSNSRWEAVKKAKTSIKSWVDENISTAEGEDVKRLRVISEQLSEKQAVAAQKQAQEAVLPQEQVQESVESEQVTTDENLQQESIASASVAENNWRNAFDKTDDVFRKGDILDAIANQSTVEAELDDVLKKAESIGANKNSKIANVYYAISQNKNAKQETRDKAKMLYDEFFAPSKTEKPQQSLDLTKKQEKQPVTKTAQKRREKQASAKKPQKTVTKTATTLKERMAEMNKKSPAEIVEIYKNGHANHSVSGLEGWLDVNIIDDAKKKNIIDHFKSTKKPVTKTAQKKKSVIQAQKTQVKPTKTVVTKEQAKTIVTDKNEDVGEKIGGARKDVWSKYKEVIDKMLSDAQIAGMTRDQLIPKIDFVKLKENGASDEALGVYAFFSSEIGKKPVARRYGNYKLSKWVESVKAFRLMAKHITETNERTDTIFKKLAKENQSIAATIEMYKKLDFINNPDVRKYTIHVDTASDGSSIYKIIENGKYIYANKTTDVSDAIKVIKERLDNKKPTERGAVDHSKGVGVFRRNRPMAGEKRYLIAYKKNGRYMELEEFDTVEAAREAKKEKMDSYVDRVIAAIAIDDMSFRNPENMEETRSYRDGKNITAEDFMDTFGFRGVEFGNWVNQAERVDRLNMAYDAFKELANILGVPDAALSLNGELGFAFGARGIKGALAHYEPGKVVINITKKNGAGTIAHEWWHSLDNYLMRKTGDGGAYLSRTRVYDREALQNSIKDIMDVIENKTKIKERSKKADMAKSKPYFNTSVEMSARAFEGYIKKKLTDAGVQNDFLVNVNTRYASDIADSFMKTDGKLIDSYPYPLDTEIDLVESAYDTFFNTLEVETKYGRPVLYDLDAVTDQRINQTLEMKEAEMLVKMVRAEVNPTLQSLIEFQIFNKITGMDKSVMQRGWYDRSNTIGIARNMSKKRFLETLTHEIRHAAFRYMSATDQKKVIDWHKSLSERDVLSIFGGDQNVLDHYREDYRNQAKAEGRKYGKNWEKIYDALMADEVVNWAMDGRYQGTTKFDRFSEIKKAYNEIMDKISRILRKINARIFGKTANANDVFALYDDAFSAIASDRYARTEGHMMELYASGFRGGKISHMIDGTGKGSGSVETKTETKKHSQTDIFKEVVLRRNSLRKAVNKAKKEFAESKKGIEIAQKVILQQQLSESANKAVIEGIKNSTYYRKEGDVSDELANGYLMQKKGRYVVVEPRRVDDYVKRGYETSINIDSLASEMGFDNGYDYLVDQMSRRAPKSIEYEQEKELSRINSYYGTMKDALAQADAKLQEAKDNKSALYLGMRIGSSVMKDKFKLKMSEFKSRKRKVRAAKDFFKLPDSVFRRIGGRRDVQYMSEKEFEGFMEHIYKASEKERMRMQAKELVVAQIQQKELKKYDNLRRAMKLPPIDKMTTEQLRQFDAALDDSQFGDEYFTQRQLETVKNTELAGIKTVREARERLAKRLGMSLDQIDNIKVAPMLDRMRFDAALADVNPFYEMLVVDTAEASLRAESQFLEIETQANELIKKARKSRKRRFGDRIAPKDDAIFAYLESENKAQTMAEYEMTDAELEASEYIRRQYERMRDYLIGAGMMDKYRNDYITHIRRGFFETWRDDGVVQAFREIFAQYQDDVATFKILESDTGNILPLEKFFQFAMKRTGGIKPTQNVAQAFLTYTKAFEKKRALDALIPKLDIYTYAIEPKRMTKNGLQMDRSLKKFLNEWMNNKKGRRFDFGGYLAQGSKADLAIRFAKAFTSMLDLGISVPAGIASNVGENVTNYVMLGTRGFAKGRMRMHTKQGRKIIKENINFIGKNPWSEIAEASKSLGDRFNESMFVLFRDAQVRANKQFLLGSLTKEEFKSGKVSDRRLAELQREMGRWRVVENAKSITGSTSIGGVFTQYKTWAVPIVRTTYKDARVLMQNVRKQGVRAIRSREGAELFRSVVIMGTIGMILHSLFDSEKKTEKEKTFAEKLIDKSLRDMLSTVGAMDPTFFISEPRLMAFASDMATAMKQIMTLEQYQQDGADYMEGDLKGVKTLQRKLTPAVIKQFGGDKQSETQKKQSMIEDAVKDGKDPVDIANELSPQLGYDENSEDFMRQWRSVRDDAFREDVRQKTGKKTERLMKVKLKTAKLKILKQYKDDMNAEEFNDYLDVLYDGKVISGPVYEEAKEL